MEPEKQSSITIFAILTTITILAWIAFDAYRRLTFVQIQTIPPTVVAPISPVLDDKILDIIEKGQTLTEEEIARFGTTKSPSPTPEASPSGEASPGGVEQ